MLPERVLPAVEDVREAALKIRPYIRNLVPAEIGGGIASAWRSGIPSRGDLGGGGILAVDGSSNSVQVGLGQKIFVLSGAGAFSGEKFVEHRTYQVGVVDLFKAEDRIRIYRETLEAKTTYFLIRSLRPDVVLLDGSIDVLLSHEPLFYAAVPVRREELPERARERIVKNFLDLCSKKRCLESLEVITADPGAEEEKLAIAGDLIELAEGGGLLGDRRTSLAISMVERLEQGASVLKMIGEALETGSTMVGVSKTSSSRILAGAGIPDLTLVHWLTRGEGYTEPRSFPLSVHPSMEEVARGVGLRLPANLELTVTYVRFSRGITPVKLEVLSDGGGPDLEDVLAVLDGVSVSGYPYPLRRAHELAKVTRDHVRAVISVLDLLPDSTGREALGE